MSTFKLLAVTLCLAFLAAAAEARPRGHRRVRGGAVAAQTTIVTPGSGAVHHNPYLTGRSLPPGRALGLRRRLTSPVSVNVYGAPLPGRHGSRHPQNRGARHGDIDDRRRLDH